MTAPDDRSGAVTGLCHRNLSFVRDARLRRMLALAGFPLRAGSPRPGEAVLVWGQTPVAARGVALAARTGAPLWRAEDAFLRSVLPGRLGGRRLGLLLDPTGGVHHDAAAPSALEHLLARDPLDDSDLLRRSRDGMARLRALELTKTNMHDPALPLPAPGYVLVVDQIAGDAAVGPGGPGLMTAMLAEAAEEHPRARILLKTHPEAAAGLRAGLASARGLPERVSLLTAPVAPYGLLDGAIAVYTISSQLGFEAILAGHRPQVFGQPFYAGWGLSDDRATFARRGRSLTRAQLFAAAMILAPLWYDPCRDRLCRFEEAVDQLEADLRAFRDDRAGYVGQGIRAWKRGHFARFFGQARPMRYAKGPDRAARVAARTGRRHLIWGDAPAPFAGAEVQAPVLRVEDGFLRSRGLGAALVPPISLILDDQGLYYDPSGPSRVETAVMAPLTDDARRRTEVLVARIVAGGIGKYNLGGAGDGLPADLPPGRRILIVGQVEDDKSLLLGGGRVRRNAELLAEARAAHPDAVLLYKAHPDVVAGLRAGEVPPATLTASGAISVAPDADPARLIDAVDEVWTMTSLLGFEALLRGRPVTCLGAPFYAGWGLTTELAPVPARRSGHRPRPDLMQLAHAALIAAPRYLDPVSGLPCPPEVALDRLIHGYPAQGKGLGLLGRLQGRAAGFAWIWRR